MKRFNVSFTGCRLSSIEKQCKIAFYHHQCNDDQPVGPEKVLDLGQSRRWNVGGLGCSAATLRPVLLPGMRLVSMCYIPVPSPLSGF